MNQLRIGIIGIGDISRVYINNLRKYDVVDIVACASRGLEKAQKKAAEFGIPRAYGSGMEVIQDPAVDCILNLTTPAAHFEYNLAALQAGKHVYSEKPLAMTFAEGKQLVEAAQKNGLYLGCAPDTFLGGRLQTCRELIDNGTLGKISGASAFFLNHGHEWHHPAPDFFYQPGAGPLFDMGPYYITALLSLLGPVRRCCAMANHAQETRIVPQGPNMGKEMPVNVETHISGVLEFVNGAIVNLTVSFDVWDSEMPRMELYGTEGTLLIQDIDPLDGPNLFGGDTLFRPKADYRWQSSMREEKFTGLPWTLAENHHPFNETSHAENSRGIGLIDMAYAIQDGRPARADGAMALHALEVMEGMLHSAKTHSFYELTTTFAQPAPLPVDFPKTR